MAAISTVRLDPATREHNRLVAEDDRYDGGIVPIRDGVMTALRVAAISTVRLDSATREHNRDTPRPASTTGWSPRTTGTTAALSRSATVS